jgi:hypothetical protein
LTAKSEKRKAIPELSDPADRWTAEMAVPLEKFFAAPLGLWDIFYDLLPQHWRAGLNSSAARRALDPHAFGHWLHIARELHDG